MDLQLERLVLAPDCTLGRLHVGSHVYPTIEQPWADNVHDRSCIPAGRYLLVPHSSALHPDTWAMVNPALAVWHLPEEIPAGQEGRFACLIHPANWAFELKGCVAPGLAAADSPKGKMVTSSRDAMARIRAVLVAGSTGHTLTITQPPPRSPNA